MIASRYTAAHKHEWDEFVLSSKNGTFLLQRGYMDYHAERFSDHSLLFRDGSGRLIALLPANQDAERLISHGGLTYGGVITDDAMTTPQMLDVFEALNAYCRQNGIRQLLYKTIPYIYRRLPAEEDRYALFRNQAKLYRRDVLAVTDQRNRLPFQERRRRKIKQAQKEGLIVNRSDNFSAFWALLSANLQERFAVKPVHSLEEISLLVKRFPEQIQLYTCQNTEGMLAGVVMYVTPRVAHAQYISASEAGKSSGALDLLFSELLDNVYKDHAYFDFGISTEQDGMHLNKGLIEQKEGFGARAVMHDFYVLDIS